MKIRYSMQTCPIPLTFKQSRSLAVLANFSNKTIRQLINYSVCCRNAIRGSFVAKSMLWLIGLHVLSIRSWITELHTMMDSEESTAGSNEMLLKDQFSNCLSKK